MAKGLSLGRFENGVYKDGHERSDVVAYRNHVFLPSLVAVTGVLATAVGIKNNSTIAE